MKCPSCGLELVPKSWVCEICFSVLDPAVLGLVSQPTPAPSSVASPIPSQRDLTSPFDEQGPDRNFTRSTSPTSPSAGDTLEDVSMNPSYPELQDLVRLAMEEVDTVSAGGARRSMFRSPEDDGEAGEVTELEDRPDIRRAVATVGTGNRAKMDHIMVNPAIPSEPESPKTAQSAAAIELSGPAALPQLPEQRSAVARPKHEPSPAPKAPLSGRLKPLGQEADLRASDVTETSTPADVERARAAQFYRQARRDLQEGRASAAMTNFRLATTFDPKNAEYTQALEALERPSSTAISDHEIRIARDLYTKATAAQDLGQFERAIDYLEAALTVSRQPALLNRLAVIVATHHRDFVRAQILLEEAISRAPGKDVYVRNLDKVLAMSSAHTDDSQPRVNLWSILGIQR